MVDSSQTRQLNIKQMNGQVVQLSVPQDIPILELKKIINEKTNMPVEFQRIIYKAKHVDDASKLSDFLKEDGQTMHLIQKTPEQARASQEEQKQDSRPNVSQGQSSGAQQDPFAMINNMMRSMNQGGAQSNPFAMIQQLQTQMPQGTQNMISQMMQPPSQNQANQGNQGLPPQLSQMINSLMSPPTAQAQPAQQTQPQAQAQPQTQQQPQNQSSGASQSQSGLSGGVIKLPHENVYELNMLCNRLMGNNSVFPGSPIPQLPFERNPMVLLGSYLCNVSFALQRLLPFMQRCGDLMQRESLLTVASHRHKTAELAMVLGECLEEVSRITGSVAHLYKNMEIGPQPGNFRLDVQSFDAMFEPLISATGAVQVGQSQRSNQSSEQTQQTSSQGQSQSSSTQANTQQQQQQPAEAPPKKNFIQKLMSDFEIREVVMISKGNVSQETVPDFPQRIRKILTSELENEQDTQANRKKLCDNMLSLIKQSLRVPEASKQAIHEGFDPCLVIFEYVEAQLPQLFNTLMDCNPDQFVETMKNSMVQAIGGLVSEIQDGFVNGSEDVFPFLAENLKAFNELAVPKQALMLNSMAVTPIMGQFASAYELYQDQQSQRAQEQPQQQQQESIAVSTTVDETPETRRQRLLEHYKKQAAEDKVTQEKLGHRPLSRAYLSLDTTTNNELAGDESKQAKESYVRDKEEKAKTRPQIFRNKMREGIIDTGLFKTASVDKELKAIDELPQELVQAYFDMIHKGLKFRLSRDQDYQQLKNQGRFEYLDKL